MDFEREKLKKIIILEIFQIFSRFLRRFLALYLNWVGLNSSPFYRNVVINFSRRCYDGPIVTCLKRFLKFYTWGQDDQSWVISYGKNGGKISESTSNTWSFISGKLNGEHILGFFKLSRSKCFEVMI